MADKYIIEGAAFNGDVPSPAEATVAGGVGGVGAWNTNTVKEAIQSELNRIYIPATGGGNSSGPVSAALVHSQNNVSLVQLPGSGNLVNTPSLLVRNPY